MQGKLPPPSTMAGSHVNNQPGHAHMHLGQERIRPQRRSTSRTHRGNPSAFSRRLRSELRGWNLGLPGIAERLLYLALLDANHPRHLTPEQDWDPQMVRRAERQYYKTLRLVANAHNRRIRAERQGDKDSMIGVRRLLHATKLSSHRVAGLVSQMRTESPTAVPHALFDELDRYCLSLAKGNPKPRRSPGGKFARRLCAVTRELSTAPMAAAA